MGSPVDLPIFSNLFSNSDFGNPIEFFEESLLESTSESEEQILFSDLDLVLDYFLKSNARVFVLPIPTSDFSPELFAPKLEGFFEKI